MVYYFNSNLPIVLILEANWIDVLILQVEDVSIFGDESIKSYRFKNGFRTVINICKFFIFLFGI